MPFRPPEEIAASFRWIGNKVEDPLAAHAVALVAFFTINSIRQLPAVSSVDKPFWFILFPSSGHHENRVRAQSENSEARILAQRNGAWLSRA